LNKLGAKTCEFGVRDRSRLLQTVELLYLISGAETNNTFARPVFGAWLLIALMNGITNAYCTVNRNRKGHFGRRRMECFGLDERPSHPASSDFTGSARDSALGVGKTPRRVRTKSGSANKLRNRLSMPLTVGWVSANLFGGATHAPLVEHGVERDEKIEVDASDVGHLHKRNQ